MTRRRPSVTLEGENGSVTIRAWGKGFRIKATMTNGDEIAEMRLAAHAANLLQEVWRSMVGDPTATLKAGPIRHISDHGETRESDPQSTVQPT